MIFKRNRTKNDEKQANITNNVCTADNNTTECSMVAKIHELQDKKTELEKELQKINGTKIPVPITNAISHGFMHYIRYDTSYIYSSCDKKDLSRIIDYLSTEELNELADGIKECVKLKVKPEQIRKELSKIKEQLIELKSQLGIA